MTAALDSRAKTGTPVWIEVRRNLWLAGKTIEEPWFRQWDRDQWTVQLAIRGWKTLNLPLSRVQRRRPS